ncbi:Uncharacterized membrane protein [Paramicrobacterium humi]|uniref:Uncharacterized membrane protein n=1 Tax=Paramicrobacterium humi TaxID=640635 RepID=A0A1H4MJQ4_9MICO|nr:vitamin K epoxide reductase family protein [Microbacterium humi]SEB82582.1 Uncharacterized membrane protein [Microbacterium humi]
MPSADHRPRALAVCLVAGGALGAVAALALTLEKIATAGGAAPNCNVSPLIGCGASLNSVQGSLLGIPNPLIGLMFWPAVMLLGVLAVAVPLPRWVWLGLTAALAGATALVVWFVVQSIAVLGILCPWCMLTWAVTVPLLLGVLTHVVRERMLPAPQPVVSAVRAIPVPWLWGSLVVFAAIAVWAQLQLDIVGSL